MPATMSWADEMDLEDTRAIKEGRAPAVMGARSVATGAARGGGRFFDSSVTDSSHGTDELSSSGMDMSSDAARGARPPPRGRRGGNKRRMERAAAAAAADAAAYLPPASAAMPPVADAPHLAQGLMMAGPIPAATAAPLPFAAPAARAGTLPAAAARAPRQRGGAGGWKAQGSGSESGGRGGMVVAPWAHKQQGRGRGEPQPPTLDDEMADFAAYVTLTPAEWQQRQDCIDALGAAAQMSWSEASALAYGSFALGLSLPVSDVDVAIDACGFGLASGFDAFCARLRELGWEVLGCMANEGDAFVKARAPAGIVCNVSLTAGRSPVREGLDLLRGLLQLYPQVHAAVLVLRTVLSQCQLTDVSTGGMSSYCILLLTIRLAQFRDPNTCFGSGMLLRDFLKHYSAEFDFATQTAAVALHGVELPEDRLHPDASVSVSDPLDARNNIAQGCAKLKQVKAMLKYCELALARWDAPPSELQEGEEAFRGRTPLSTIIAAKAVAGRKRH